MNKRQFLALFLALSLVLTATAGCAPPAEEPPEEPAVEIPADPEPEPKPEPEPEPIPEPEPDPEPELEDPEESEIRLLEPDRSAPTNRPLKEVENITDQQATQALSVPLDQLRQLDNTSITWGPGIASGEQPPSEPARLQQAYGSMGADFVKSDKEIYLTFDEGYELGYTPMILDTLAEKDVQAVFFVTLGYVRSRPDLVQRMIDEGHVVGNHSSSHPVGGMPTMDTLDMAKDVLYLHEYVLENFGYEMTLFRPPEGTFSAQSLAVLEALGYRSMFWSFAYNDWNPDNQMDPTAALDVITSRSHPGAIYLLHAVSATNTTVLGQAIDTLRSKGYTFARWT